MWITLIKLSYTPLQGFFSHPDIHQGEKLYGRLLPSVRRVSEKNSSRKLVNKDNKKGRTPSYELRAWPKANSRAEDVLLGGKV